MMMANLSNSALVRRSQAGERAAFATLIERHRARLRHTLLPLLSPEIEIDDLLQEAFLQALLNLPTLRNPSKFRAWLCGIGINLARMWQRSAQGQLKKTHYERPLTPDLTHALLGVSKTTIRKVTVSKIVDRVYYGELLVDCNGVESTVDCRLSDAIVLASRLDVPIFVTPEVMDSSGKRDDTLIVTPKQSYAWDVRGETMHWISMLA
jgi:bifunctional DNase/RNase